MPRAPKINVAKLVVLLDQGFSASECAKKFKVTPQAIHRHLQRMGRKASSNVAATRKAEVIVDNQLDAVKQLKKIKEASNDVLDMAWKAANGNQSALKKLSEKVATDKSIRYKVQDPHKLVLRAVAEIRQLINLEFNIYEMLHDMRAVKEFQETVIEVLEEFEPGVRAKVLHKLQERRAIRSAITFGA